MAVIWGVNGHPSYTGLTVAQQLALAHQIGLTSYRVEVYDSTPATISYLTSLQSAAAPLGIGLIVVIIPNQAASNTNANAYQWGHDNALALATQFPGLTWELGNEMDQVCIKAGATGLAPTDYDDTLFGLVSNSIQGMRDGVIAGDPAARSIVDITGQHFGFFQKLQANSVAWDITGIHFYAQPASSQDIATGADSLFGTLSGFGRPIAMTEFNQVDGSLTSLQSEADAIINMMNAISGVAVQYNVIGALIYELLDEPTQQGGEAVYGLATSTGTLKAAGAAVRTFLSGFSDMALASFAPTGGVSIVATPVSARLVIPTTGTPTIALVTNLGDHPVFVALGDGTVVATATSVPVLPGSQLALAIGAATNIAAATLSGVAAVSVAVGT